MRFPTVIYNGKCCHLHPKVLGTPCKKLLTFSSGVLFMCDAKFLLTFYFCKVLNPEAKEGCKKKLPYFILINDSRLGMKVFMIFENVTEAKTWDRV